MKDWLFPLQKRDFTSKRLLSVVLRSFHLLGIAGLAGHFLFALPLADWQLYSALALVTGVLLVALELYSDAIWLLQLRGQAILLKLGLLASSFAYPQYAAYIFWIIILISGFFSHAPRTIRYYVPHLGRVAETSAVMRNPQPQ